MADRPNNDLLRDLRFSDVALAARVRKAPKAWQRMVHSATRTSKVLGGIGGVMGAYNGGVYAPKETNPVQNAGIEALRGGLRGGIVGVPAGLISGAILHARDKAALAKLRTKDPNRYAAIQRLLEYRDR